MKLEALTAISPIDGRYRDKTECLYKFFSEFALIKYRVKVEIEYFIALCEIPLPQLSSIEKKIYRALREIYENFTAENALQIKEIEQTTNHDVKAVEYFIKQEFEKRNLSEHKEFIHFGLTSQDINNTAIPMSLQDAFNEVYYPLIQEVLSIMFEMTEKWENVPMLARTHGQPASPTRLGKEIEVFTERLRKQLSQLHLIPFSAKFGGATGNFNAHVVAFPQTDWVQFANTFVNHILNLDRSQTTTQIDHYDNLSALFDNLRRINIILIDLCRDIWTYISINYFKLKIKQGEIGSSAMPHKVNPIDFENAEGNLGIANAVFEHLSNKLPISRLQRDLTDSTVLRNIGVPFAHTLIALKSIQKGLQKLELNSEAIKNDLTENYVVIAEAFQTILRREKYPQPYEVLKELTRNNEKLNKKNFDDFIEKLNVSEKIKSELKNITPENYIGI